MSTPIKTDKLQLPEGADPIAILNNGLLYSKDVAGVTELFYMASDGAISQLTPPGVDVSPVSNALVYQPGGGATGPVVYDSWPDLVGQLDAMRAASGAVAGGPLDESTGQYAIVFDVSFAGVCTIPAGPVGDMEDVTWYGRNVNDFQTVMVSNGATFTGLRAFKENLYVLNENLVTPMIGDLEAGDYIDLHNASIETIAGGAPFFDATGVGPGEIVFVLARDFSWMGAFSPGPVFNFPTAGSTLVINRDGSSFMVPSTLVGAVGAVLNLASDSFANNPTVFPAWAGTVVTPSTRMNVPPALLPFPYLAAAAVTAITPAFHRWTRYNASGGPLATTLTSISGLAAAGGYSQPGAFVLLTEEGGGVLTVAPGAGDTIDGAAGARTVPPNGSLLLICDGVSRWRRVASFP